MKIAMKQLRLLAVIHHLFDDGRRPFSQMSFHHSNAGLGRFAQVVHNQWLRDDHEHCRRFLCIWEATRRKLAAGKVHSSTGGILWRMLIDGIEKNNWGVSNEVSDAVGEFLRQHDRATRKPLAVVTDLAAKMRLAPAPELEEDEYVA